MPESVDELKRLSPQERIKRLKELEEERKKEIEQAEELIKETVREIADAEEKKRIPIPQARATDLSALGTAEEKQIVATHHLLAAETATAAPVAPTALPQQKSLEEVAAEEGLTAQQQAKQQPQQFQRPVYDTGSQQQKSALGEYIRASQQTATSGGMPHEASREASQLERITEFYKERAFAESSDADTIKRSYQSSPVTGGYEIAKREQEERKEQSDFYKRRGGPA